MTTTIEKRRALNAHVSTEAHEQWRDFAEVNRVSVSALLEAICPMLAAGLDGDLSKVSVTDQLEVLVEDARKVDVRRRRR